MKRAALLSVTLLLALGSRAQDPLYDRPFVGNVGQTAIGGYLEGNTNYFSQDGVSEGFSMELRRFNVFLFASMGPRLTFISELEFEHGTEEIALETALIDFLLSPAATLRAGILLPPLGVFNQNHDSPRWHFVDRPLVSTELIPSTLSEVGFGLHGEVPTTGLRYQLYAVNGLGAGVTDNAEGRTHIPSGKGGEAFGEDNNGTPAWTGRLEAEPAPGARIGVSGYRGVYNSWRVEGEPVDEKRTLTIAALDADVALGRTRLVAEAASAWIEVPEGLSELYGTRQWGGFLDVVHTIHEGRLGALERVEVAAVVRLEHLDRNVGRFQPSGRPIHDQESAVVVGFSFRPGSETIFKTNYRYHWQRDLIGNPGRLGGFQVGFASYF